MEDIYLNKTLIFLLEYKFIISFSILLINSKEVNNFKMLIQD